ncbi:MAG TPA: hypothetical protein VMS56_12085 [Thermoanaerobaculia bacterium]|nr:hypothetical protein [Thermoanaerobaculia bacterium]
MKPAALALLLILVGCSAAPAPLETVRRGETVTLGMGESGRLEPGGVILQFAAVIADSRCPVGVTCVWEGEAEVALRASSESGEAAELRLHTRGETAVRFAGHRIRLLELAPHPIEGKPLRQSDYELTIGVE